MSMYRVEGTTWMHYREIINTHSRENLVNLELHEIRPFIKFIHNREKVQCMLTIRFRRKVKVAYFEVLCFDRHVMARVKLIFISAESFRDIFRS